MEDYGKRDCGGRCLWESFGPGSWGLIFIDMMKTVFDKNTRVIVSSTENREHVREALKEHLEILDCLLEQDFEKAAVMMRTHVAGCRNAALDFFYSA